jgi:uncharacterized delta-60 repeat protein
MGVARFRGRIGWSVVCLVCAVNPGAALAASGGLDHSFAGDGKRITNFGLDDGSHGVAIQADGRIVVAGDTQNPRYSHIAVARYRAGGRLDHSFSGDGMVRTDVRGRHDYGKDVAVQANGKIVVVGETGFSDRYETSYDFAIVRYNHDGSLDRTFAGDGIKTLDFGGSNNSATAYAVAIQGDGKIVVAGETFGGAPPGNDFALVRLQRDGSLDRTFSGDGKERTDLGALEGARGVAIQDDGRIVAVGRSGLSDYDFAVARYTQAGSLDTSFSADGIQTTDFGGFDLGNDVAVQDADNKIVAVGRSGSQFALARYDTNGDPDLTFTGDGKQTTGFAGTADAEGVAIQADGKILAFGSAVPSAHHADFALARYTTFGELDLGFSGDGKQTTDLLGNDTGWDLALQSNGRIVVTGSSFPSGAGRDDPTGGFATARLLP